MDEMMDSEWSMTAMTAMKATTSVANDGHNNSDNVKTKRCLETTSAGHQPKRLREYCWDADQSAGEALSEDYPSESDSNYTGDDEWLQWEQMSATDRKLYDISNLMDNFSINRVEMPEWPDASEGGSHPAVWPPLPPPYEKFPPSTGTSLFGFQLNEVLTASKRTVVFIGHRLVPKVEPYPMEPTPGAPVIVKVAIEGGYVALKQEYDNYHKLLGCAAIPRVYYNMWWRDFVTNHRIIHWGIVVTELFGQNLLTATKQLATGLPPIADVEAIAIQMINCVESIHDKGFIHCSLKPENFVIDTNGTTLKIIGFRYAKQFMIKQLDGSVAHIEDKSNGRKLPTGDPNFHSIGYHNGFCLARRDDMESLGYCLVFLAKGSLPWMSANDNDLNAAKTIRKIGERMQKTSLEALCDGLPKSFAKYFDLISHYNFKDKPNYEELRQCYRSAIH